MGHRFKDEKLDSAVVGSPGLFQIRMFRKPGGRWGYDGPVDGAPKEIRESGRGPFWRGEVDEAHVLDVIRRARKKGMPIQETWSSVKEIEEGDLRHDRERKAREEQHADLLRRQSSPPKMRFKVGDRVRDTGVVGVVERVDATSSSPGYSVRLEESRYPQWPVGSILFGAEHGWKKV